MAEKHRGVPTTMSWYLSILMQTAENARLPVFRLAVKRRLAEILGLVAGYARL